MAHNILLESKINSNILANITNLFNTSKELEKSKTALLNNNETELLNSILHILTLLIQDIKNQYNKEIFTINDIVNFINQHSLNVNISTLNNFTKEIESNKVLIESIVLLLILIQIDENSLNIADINLNINSNNLTIEMGNFIEYNSYQKDILFEKESHKFVDECKKFYGLYLFLIKTIAKKLNAIVNIEKQNGNMYKINISVPVKINSIKNIETNPEDTLSILDKKIAIYESSKYFSHKIEEFLNDYNLNVEIIPYNKGKTPNLTSFDLLIIDSKLIDKKLSDQIFTLKLINNFKVIIVDESGDINSSYINLANKILSKKFSKEELTLSIANLFDKKELKPIKSKKSTPINIDKSSNKKRVIVADSNITNLKLLEYLIKEHNFDVLSTKNGKEVIDLLEKYGADLIIIDNNLEEMNGYDVVKLIRANSKYKHIPIAIHSSFSMDNQSISNIFLAGFDSYLPKPFSNKDIDTLLKRYLKVEDKVTNKESVKEFLALYQDIDTLIEKYTNNKQIAQLNSLLINLKKELNKLKNKELVADIDKILISMNSSNLDTILIKQFINKYQSYIFSLTN